MTHLRPFFTARFVRLGRLVCPLALVATLAACKGGAGAEEPLAARHRPERLMPLADGNVWTYDAYDQDGHGPTIAGIQVSALSDTDFVVSSLFSENSRETYQVRPEGIFLPDSDAWLLLAPLTVGQRWRTRNDRQAEVVNTSVRIETPRGTFDHCVQVNEDGGEMEIHVETVYCTDIGAVAMASSITSDITRTTVTQRAELREYVVGAQADEAEE